MPFVNSYNGAMKLLSEIENGTCKDSCKKIWMRNLKYALKTKTNPLKLTKPQRKNITEKMKGVSGKKNHTKTLKKYKNRKSPPYSANQNCNKTMVGNDGNKYISKPNKNNICTWRKL